MISTERARGGVPKKRVVVLLVAALAIKVQSADAQTAAEAAGYATRAVTRTDGKITVAAAVLSDEEGEALYGVPLAGKSIQPVWLRIRNDDDRAYWLLMPGLDPSYFTPSEAAEAFPADDREAAARLGQFYALKFPNPVPPGRAAEGFVLVTRQEGARLVQVDLAADGRFRSFSIVAVVPGLQADYQASQVFERDPYPPGQVVDLTDEAAFRKALEALPCCVTNAAGDRNGDPLNLVVVGGVSDAFASLVRRGWSLTEQTWSGSVMRMVGSAFSGERYAYAPISNLYLFGRKQDIALQKARDNIHQRNHLRLWKAPMRFRGQTVWVGQISRDIGSRLTIHSPTLTTHKIDPDIDLAAMSLLGDLFYSQNLKQFAFAAGVGAAPKEAPRRNLTTDPYYTSGLRLVLFFDPVPTAMENIEGLPWEKVPRVETGLGRPEGAR